MIFSRVRSAIRFCLSLSGLDLVDRQAFREFVSKRRKVVGLEIRRIGKVLVRSSHKKTIDEFCVELKAAPDISKVIGSRFQNWESRSDARNIQDTALEHRAELSTFQYPQAYCNKYAASITASNGRVFWRLETVRRLRLSRPNLFSGRVLEIGAGTAVVSASVSKYPEVNEVYSLDYELKTVEHLMPLVQWSMGARSEKITRVAGSYNRLQVEDGYFDAIIAVGALHHSEDLSLTLRECHRALRDGGTFVVIDYSLAPDLTQLEYAGMRGMPLDEKEMSNAILGKRVMTNRLNSEHARPIYVYQAAAFNAGFSVETILFDATKDTGGALRRLLRYVQTSRRMRSIFVDRVGSRTIGYDAFGNVRAFSYEPTVHYPFYAKGAPSLLSLIFKGDRAGSPIYDNTVLICRKGSEPDSQAVRYRSGKVYEMPLSMLPSDFYRSAQDA